MTTTNATVDTHPFAHLGPAPYRFVGLETNEDREAANASRKSDGLVYTTNMCGGSCDHCGAAISNVYMFEASNGKRFKVGCECAEKAAKKGERIPRYLADARKAKRARDTKKRHEREAVKRRELREMLNDDATRDVLRATPHPSKYRNEKGETLLDWADWMFEHSGAAGTAKTLKAVKKALD